MSTVCVAVANHVQRSIVIWRHLNSGCDSISTTKFMTCDLRYAHTLYIEAILKGRRQAPNSARVTNPWWAQKCTWGAIVVDLGQRNPVRSVLVQPHKRMGASAHCFIAPTFRLFYCSNVNIVFLSRPCDATYLTCWSWYFAKISLPGFKLARYTSHCAFIFSVDFIICFRPAPTLRWIKTHSFKSYIFTRMQFPVSSDRSSTPAPLVVFSTFETSATRIEVTRPFTPFSNKTHNDH